jgi:hypothetical protein
MRLLERKYSVCILFNISMFEEQLGRRKEIRVSDADFSKSNNRLIDCIKEACPVKFENKVDFSREAHSTW